MNPDETGRPEAADQATSDATMTPSAALAYWLNDLREVAGQSYSSLAKASGLSKTTINDALTGRTGVSHRVFFAVVQTCSRDIPEWEAYWEQMSRLIRAGNQPAPADELMPAFRRPALQSSPDPQTVTPASETDALTLPLSEPSKLARRRRRRRRRWLLAGLAALLLFVSGATTGGVVVDRWVAHPDIGTDGEFMEVQWHRTGGPTYADPATLSRPGEKIPFGRWVRVQCRVYLPSVPSVSPDGYWYLVTSPPWNGEYYAAANTFLNGDPEQGPYEHNTDMDVKVC